ncbi:MAG: hypothetical protein WDA02_09645 [Saccharofermentanales bacterium]
MKHIKTYNESIKHLLKPKNEGDILKSIKEKPDTNKYILSLIYDMNWLSEFINVDELKTTQITYEQYDRLLYFSVRSFTYEEKTIINNNIETNDKKERKYYTYNDISSLYINHKQEWIVNKYDKFILVRLNYRDENGTVLLYFCPNLDELIKLLKINNIEAREYNHIKKQFIDK